MIFLIKKINLKNYIDKFLIVFLIIQPIFDMKFFYNSISTLIRVIIIFALFLYYFFTSKNKKKYWLIIYPILVSIYFVFHHLNALNFNSLVPGNFNYSIIKELLYFVKMLTPFLLIYCLYKASFSTKTIVNIIKIVVLIISFIIVISNLLLFSYGSYSDIRIKANFFEWFNPNSSYNYQDLASKGLFEYGNQIAAILIMFLPFIIYSALSDKSIGNYIIFIFSIFALILLCTKVSVLGIFVVFAYTLITSVFISFTQKKPFHFKKYIPTCSILFVSILLLPINPMFGRISERNSVIEASSNNIQEEQAEIIPDETIADNTIDNTITPALDNNQVILDYIENNYESKQLHKQFLFDNYPYKYDPEFWYDFLQNDISLTTDYRYVEISMIKRVLEINNNSIDKWFGITNTRLQNIFNIERDFVVQYYALGIIGLILVFMPYFVFLIIFSFKTIKMKFKNLNLINSLSAISIIFAFGISYFTGNLLNSLSFTIYFSILFYLLSENKAVN